MEKKTAGLSYFEEKAQIFVEKTAELIVNHCYLMLVVLILITAFFAYNVFKISVVTNMADLLATRHPYVKLDKQFRSLFGGSNLVLVQVRAKKGDIFNEAALGAVRRITDKLIFFPGVDRNKVYSIAARKIKDVKVTAWGMEVPPLMWPNIPRTSEELNDLKKRIFVNDTIYGKFVSFDGRAALVSSEFFEEGINYRALFKEFQNLRSEEENDNVEINMAGDPIIYGYIDHYLTQTSSIFFMTLIVIIGLLYLYTRSIMFMVLPALSAVISGIWGAGFAGVLGYNIDPLILVVPLLITARALSHSVQFNARLVEEVAGGVDKKEAVRRTIVALLYPGLAGIITDGVGVLLLAIIPIPILTKLAFICFFWAMSVCFAVLMFNPVITLCVPIRLKGVFLIKQAEEKRGFFDLLLIRIAGLNKSKKNSWEIIFAVFVLFIVVTYLNLGLIIGDAKPGTPLLWPKSRYNTDEAKINQYFPGVMNPLLIVVQGLRDEAIKEPAVLETMADFQRYLLGFSEVGGTLSYVDLVKGLSMKFYEDMPKWSVIPDTKEGVGMIAYLMEGGGAEPGDYDKYVDYQFKTSNITVFCNDRMGTTIENVLNHCKNFITKTRENKSISELIEFKIGAGLIALRGSINEELARYQLTLLILSLLSTSVFCCFFFQAWSPGWMLIVPLFVANYFVFGYMAAMKIGLNINTLPVASIAVGIGVDYGIYLLARVKEEYAATRNLEDAVSISIRTTGKAIAFTALTIILSVVIWVFSSIRFQAEMGILFSIVTLCHLLGTLIFLPAIILLVRPKFIMKQ